MAAPKLAGQSLAEGDLRARINCTVVAVERDGALIRGVAPDFVPQYDDTQIVVGRAADVHRFNELVS